MLKLTKSPPPTGGGSTFYYTNHIMKRFTLHVYHKRTWNGFENGFEIGENTQDWVLLTNFDGNSLFFSVNWARLAQSYRYMIESDQICIDFLRWSSISRTNKDFQWNTVYCISSNLMLWRYNDSSAVVMSTWSWCGKPAASARACLREANVGR